MSIKWWDKSDLYKLRGIKLHITGKRQFQKIRGNRLKGGVKKSGGRQPPETLCNSQYVHGFNNEMY